MSNVEPIRPKRVHTAERLRAEIDRGRTGDKIDFPDPAAAPLGGDDEAAGTPIGSRRAALASAQETSGPRTIQNRKPGPGAAWVLIGVVVASAVVAFTAWLTLASP